MSILKMSKSNCEILPVEITSSVATNAIQKDVIDSINEQLDNVSVPKADLEDIEELLRKLQAVNAIFAKQLGINEARHSSLQRRLDREVKQLTALYDELKCCKQCLDLLAFKESVVKVDVTSMERECQNVRRSEMQELERAVAKQEPALYQSYKLLYKFPERRKGILEGLETRMANKRKALDDLASIIYHKRLLYNLAKVEMLEEPKSKRLRPPSFVPVVLRPPRGGFPRRDAVWDLNPVFEPLPPSPDDISAVGSDWDIV